MRGRLREREQDQARGGREIRVGVSQESRSKIKSCFCCCLSLHCRCCRGSQEAIARTSTEENRVFTMAYQGRGEAHVSLTSSHLVQPERYVRSVRSAQTMQ